MAQDRHVLPALPVVVMVVHMAMAFGAFAVWVLGLVVRYAAGGDLGEDSIVASVMEMFGGVIGTVTDLAGMLFAVLFGLTLVWFILLKSRVALGFRIAYTAHIGAEAAVLLYPVPALLEQDMAWVAAICVSLAALLAGSVAYVFFSRELRAYLQRAMARPARPAPQGDEAPAGQAPEAPEYTGPELP